MKISNKTKSRPADLKKPIAIAVWIHRFLFIIMLLQLAITTFLYSDTMSEPALDKVESNKPYPKSASLLPIAMYDSDTGFGFGAKMVAKNYCRKRESFDLMLFASSKGEQTYTFLFSMPDKEFRQKTKFPAALDLKAEFSKLIKSNFFGFGNYTQDNNYQFPKESSTLQFTFSRAFSDEIMADIGLRLTHYSVYDYDSSWHTITKLISGASENHVIAIPFAIRYDSRNNTLNPSNGIRVEMRFEQAVKAAGSDWTFHKYRLESSIYRQVIKTNHVIALRCWLQQIEGRAPYLELSKIGDSWTARGYKADRFIDKAMGLVSAESRFSLYKNLGGVIFLDLGRVWKSLGKFSFSDWHSGWGAGLRYSLNNFVTRLDFGHSNEGTRIFLNFGQVF